MIKEILNEHIDAIISNDGERGIKVIAGGIWLVLVLSLIYIHKYGGFIASFTILIIAILFIEYKLRTNATFAKETISISEALDVAKTGDLVFFRSFHSYDLPELLFFRYLAASISNTYFGHVGVIIRMNDKVYIAECTEDVRFDELTRKNKNGPLLDLADPRIRTYYGRVHLCRTNLEEHFRRNHTNVTAYIDRMKHMSFFERGVGCVGYVKGLLHAAGAMHSNTGPSVLASLLKQNRYKVPIRFESPLLIRNQWYIQNDL